MIKTNKKNPFFSVPVPQGFGISVIFEIAYQIHTLDIQFRLMQRI